MLRVEEPAPKLPELPERLWEVPSDVLVGPAWE